MRTRRSPRDGGRALRLGTGAILLAALTVGGQSGCTREFFREWANQDVSEAIFEKSRDPRWRLDTFSIEPPALSRHADPYDQDAPPAPPDDIPAEALSPVPQWPSNRLIVPVEGTGYLDLLEYWQRNDYPPLDRYREPAPRHPALVGLPSNMGVGGVPPSLSSDWASRPAAAVSRPYTGMANPVQARHRVPAGDQRGGSERGRGSPQRGHALEHHSRRSRGDRFPARRRVTVRPHGRWPRRAALLARGDDSPLARHRTRCTPAEPRLRAHLMPPRVTPGTPAHLATDSE